MRASDYWMDYDDEADYEELAESEGIDIDWDDFRKNYERSESLEGYFPDFLYDIEDEQKERAYEAYKADEMKEENGRYLEPKLPTSRERKEMRPRF